MQQPEVPAGTPILAPQPDEPTEDYTYLLSGVPQDDLFDNILYAD